MTLLIALGVAALLALVGVLVYNRLVSLRQGTSQAFADIDVQLRLRADLIPNLVNTVKRYAEHEREVLQAVTDARTKSVSAATQEEAARADGLMTAALGRLIAVAESYPDLKANQNFAELQAELSDVENKLAAARRFLNLAVSEYNAAIEQFPALVFASALGFKAKDFYSLGEERRAELENAPQVTF